MRNKPQPFANVTTKVSLASFQEVLDRAQELLNERNMLRRGIRKTSNHYGPNSFASIAESELSPRK